MTDTTVSTSELKQWAEKRADDAGRLARELLPYRLRTQPVNEPAVAPLRDAIAWIVEAPHDEHCFTNDPNPDACRCICGKDTILDRLYEAEITTALTKQEGSATLSVEFECPINQPGCTKNCGSYGCGN